MIALATSTAQAPSVVWNAIAPFLVLGGGAIVTLFVALVSRRFVQRGVVPVVAALVLIAAAVLFALRIGQPKLAVMTGALGVDDLTCVFSLLFIAAALCAIVMAARSDTLTNFGRGEFYALLITVVLGMSLLAAASNLVVVFLALELLSVPLYVICASDLRREGSLEAGLKYLIVGSLGSATLLYGLALTYGATGSTDFPAIARALAHPSVGGDALALAGVALTLVGIAFKASIAPFHQWTPDVYEGAPTPVTAFMAVATKAAAFALLVRYTGQALMPVIDQWRPALSALAVVTIVVGNLGAMGQSSLKRMLGYSGVAHAGYLLVGVIVADAVGVRALVFYLLSYLFMNIAPFAVITARERAGGDDSLNSMRNLGREVPALAWAMTISMITLAGLPLTVGFIGKIFLIVAAVNGGYAWLGVLIVAGSAMSLVYYLRVIAAIWMGAGSTAAGRLPGATAAPAGASPEADASHQRELVGLAVVTSLACIVFGAWPAPLLDLAHDAALAFVQLF